MNDKVDSGRSVEETQERTRRNEGRITEVDTRAGAAEQAAAKANTAAGEAQNAANSAATAAGARADRIEALSRRLVFEVLLSEDQGNFGGGKTDLPDEAKARLDRMITDLKADPKGAYFEIEGHTDNVSDTLINQKIGLERAEAVKRYLYEQHQIPLQNQRDQLRRREAGGAQPNAGWPRAEPPGGREGRRVAAPHTMRCGTALAGRLLWRLLEADFGTRVGLAISERRAAAPHPRRGRHPEEAVLHR